MFGFLLLLFKGQMLFGHWFSISPPCFVDMDGEIMLLKHEKMGILIVHIFPSCLIYPNTFWRGFENGMNFYHLLHHDSLHAYDDEYSPSRMILYILLACACDW